MKKVTDFIIKYRYFIVIFFIAFAIVSTFLSQKVNINYEISEYLPENSETKIGLNIMNKEFDDKMSSLNIMFKGLTKKQKKDIYDELLSIKGVSKVDHDFSSRDYNYKEYTLYTIHVDDLPDSKISKDVYNKVKDSYKDYEFYLSGDINKKNMTILPLWIVILAVSICTVILIIMCESFVEPFLFLACIGIAVLLNKGTNIMFSSVSHITNSISAILQMALSMDYSIMLINRYRQEKEKSTNNIEAMKEALYKSFSSISSSSITTIVGLVTLVFMSFTIGKDLGLVLAKGVFFSLIVIFTCLPAFILMFDKLIVKSKKKTPNINLVRLSNIIYKFRSLGFILLFVLFLGSFLLKGNVGILYTPSSDNKIKDIFKENNQLAIIYDNKDEDLIAPYLKELEKQKKVKEVLAFSNTIGEKLKYNEFNKKLESLNVDTSIDEYLLKIIYYNYYNPNNDIKMSFEELINFFDNKIINNDKFSSKLDSNIDKDINRLKNFTYLNEINKRRTYKEISNILEIDENDIYNLFVLYYSDKENISLTLNEFMNFINSDILSNSEYSSNISLSDRDSLVTLSKYLDIDKITKSMNYNEMSELFSLNREDVNKLYLYYYSIYGVNNKLSLNEFANFVLNEVYLDDEYKNYFDENIINELKKLDNFTNLELIDKDMDSSLIASTFEVDEEMVKELMLLKYSKTDNGTSLSLLELSKFLIDLRLHTNYLDNVDFNLINAIKNISIRDLLKNKKYTATEVGTLFGVESEKTYMLYALYDYRNGNTDDWTFTPYEFTNFILDNKENDLLKDKLDSNTLITLEKLLKIMNSAKNNEVYDFKDLANFIELDEELSKKIYALYAYKYDVLTLKPIDFVNFILSHKDDDLLKDKLDDDNINNLNLVKVVMESVINNKKYTSIDVSNLLNTKKDSLELLYSLYSFKYIDNEKSISLKEFIDFILRDVVNNDKYKDRFSSDKLVKLNTLSDIMNSSINNVKYNSNDIYNIILNLTDKVNKNDLDVLYVYYGSYKYYDYNYTLSIEEFINYLTKDIFKDPKFSDFIEVDMKDKVNDAKVTLKDSKKKLVGKNYSRIVLNTEFDLESKEVYNFIKKIYKKYDKARVYVIGDSSISYEMSNSFRTEFDYISILTMIAIFIVVAITFKSLITPLVLVTIIQCAVYMTMVILGFMKEDLYFISLLIVQSILMGATIDYAIVYTSYYLELRKNMDIKESIRNAYNKSIHTILTSSSILILSTFIVGSFADDLIAMICKTIAKGVLCSTILILIILPASISFLDRFIVKNRKK